MRHYRRSNGISQRTLFLFLYLFCVIVFSYSFFNLIERDNNRQYEKIVTAQVLTLESGSGRRGESAKVLYRGRVYKSKHGSRDVKLGAIVNVYYNPKLDKIWLHNDPVDYTNVYLVTPLMILGAFYLIRDYIIEKNQKQKNNI